MFDLDRWREIFQSINKNRLRSVMSGFTVSFAILLFTLLFGIANGLGNFFKGTFVDTADNSISVRVRQTSKPYKGLQAGRKIQLKNKDYFIKKGMYCCGTIAGGRSQFSIAAGSGAAVATDVLTLWNNGNHVKVHDKI